MRSAQSAVLFASLLVYPWYQGSCQSVVADTSGDFFTAGFLVGVLITCVREVSGQHCRGNTIRSDYKVLDYGRPSPRLPDFGTSKGGRATVIQSKSRRA